MKFLIDKNGVEAVNVQFVEKIFVERVIFEDGTSMVCVAAQISGEDEDFILKEFDSDNEDENFSDAKDYFADLIKTLNA